MSDLFFPKQITYGANSLNKILPECNGNIIIISDGGFVQIQGFLGSVEQRLKRKAKNVRTIIKTNPDDLYREAAEQYFSHEAECIVAIGCSWVIDCGMLLSKESGAEFIAIPTSVATAMTEFERGNYFSYVHSPDRIVLAPELIYHVLSGNIAYEGLACLCYGLDAACDIHNSIVSDMAFEGIVGIINNLVPAFRGNRESSERLMYAMYLTVCAHRNSRCAEHSVLTGLSKYFTSFGYDSNAVCAVCLPNYAEFIKDISSDMFCRIANQTGIATGDDTPDSATAKIIDEFRRIQASLCVPRSISGFGLSDDEYCKTKLDQSVPVDLLDLCYHGSFKFARM